MNRLLFISDLHLSAELPILTEAFLALLQQETSNIDALYILGDWFESWVGDDDDEMFLLNIIEHLKAFTEQGKQIYIQHGNRDFLIGETFVKKFNGQLLSPETSIVHHRWGTCMLEHGDRLCTDDIKYQNFRSLSRDSAWQEAILSQPLPARKEFARLARLQSQMNQANTPMNIMDTNQQAVNATLEEAQYLIHGHTHRPQVHNELHHKQRFVLGDWRISESHDYCCVDSFILRMTNDDLTLEPFHYKTTKKLS